jgi:hypothetical protein
MKITPVDRLQALRHSKVYRKDFDTYVKKRGNESDMLAGGVAGHDVSIKLSEAGKKLCMKWNLLNPISPYEPFTEDDTRFVQPIVSTEGYRGYCQR